MNTVVKRMKRRTPKFFKTVRNAGLTLAGVGAAILAAPVALPAIVLQIGGYLTLAGTVAGMVSQTAVTNEKK
jgi:hypothetical protein